MTDAQGIARLQLKSIVERVERLEAEIADLNADKSDIYKDARGNGFDVKAIKKVVSRRKLDDNKRVEEDVVFETYWDAVHGTGLVHAHARENIEEFDAETGEILDGNVDAKLVATVATGMQTEIGRKALIAAVDIMIAREEADEEFQAKASGDNGAIEQDIEDTADSVTGDASRSSRGDDTPASNSETHQRPSTNDEPSPEVGPQAEASPAGTGAGTLADREGRQNGEAAGTAYGLPTNQPETAPEEAAPHEVADVNSVESVRPQAETAATGSIAANTGGDHVTGGRNAQPDQAGSSFKAHPATHGIVMETVPPVPMKTLPYAHCFPDLSKTAYQRLADDIAMNGVNEPIVRMGDVIVDGWNRYNAARSLGIEYPVIEYGGDDILLDLIKWQRADRDWSPSQERKIADALAKEIPDHADDIMAAFQIEHEGEPA